MDIAIKQNVIYVVNMLIKNHDKAARISFGILQIETYMKRQGLPVTGIIVPCLYQQFLQPPLLPTKTANNQYYLGEQPNSNCFLTFWLGLGKDMLFIQAISIYQVVHFI